MSENLDDQDTGFNSALDLWQEAVEKAGVDLEKIVKNSVEQLARYSEELEKSLAQQLKKIADQTASMVETNVEDLTAKKDEIAEQLAEFERSEADEMLKSAQDAREKIYSLVDKTKADLVTRLGQAMKEMSQLADASAQGRFKSFTEKNRETLAAETSKAREKIAGERSNYESQLKEKARELEGNVEEVVALSKTHIEDRLADYETGFDEKIAKVLSQLDDMLIATAAASDKATTQGIADLETGQLDNEEFLTTQVEQWKGGIDNIVHRFQEDLETTREAGLSTHSRRLNYNVSEAKASINQLASDAMARITGNHRMYYGSLKRLERKYAEQVIKLFNKLESVIGEEREISSNSANQSTDEIKEKLRSHLMVRGSEVVKTYTRQVEQMEGDFSRASSSSYERIDSIRLQAVESLEKQVRIIRSELERIEKLFKQELSQVSIELPEIEDRGRVAAMSVSAYQTSMLSLDAD